MCNLEERISKPADFLILNLLILPHEHTSQGRDKFPVAGVLALKSAPYAPNQGPPGPLGIQVGVKLGDLTCTPEPLACHKAAMVCKYRQQALLTSARSRGLTGIDTCPLDPGQQQAHAPAQPWYLLKLLSFLLHSPPEGPAALKLQSINTDVADGTTGHRVEHDGCDRDTSSQRQNKRYPRQQRAAAS